MDKSRC